MDSKIHRLCEEQVFDQVAVPESQKLALRCFLKSWHGKDAQGQWMRSQKGWKQAAALLASAQLEPGTGVNPYRILMCGFGRKLCERGDQCRRCALDRIDFAWSEFQPAWEKAKHWCAMVLAMDRRADYAGIHEGDGSLDPKNEATPVFRPFEGRSNGFHTLHSGSELQDNLYNIKRAFFETVKAITHQGLIAGAFVHFEIAFSFWAGESNYDGWSHVRHRIEPQLNVLVNSSRPFDLPLIHAVYHTFFACLRRLPAECRLDYPDLWFSPILNQKGMATWISYMLKSWHFDEWYQEALNHRCDRRELNICFDEIVFENAHRLACPKAATRRYGNLHLNPNNPSACIAQRIPEALTQHQIKLLKDEEYAAEHPELEDALLFWAEKRRKRRGHSQDVG